IRTFAHLVKDFGGNHDFFAPGEVTQRAAHDLLTGTVRIGVGSVEEIYPELEGSLDERATLFFVETPGVRAAFRYAVGHATEANTRNFETGFPKVNVFHSEARGVAKLIRAWAKSRRVGLDTCRRGPCRTFRTLRLTRRIPPAQRLRSRRSSRAAAWCSKTPALQTLPTQAQTESRLPEFRSGRRCSCRDRS